MTTIDRRPADSAAPAGPAESAWVDVPRPAGRPDLLAGLNDAQREAAEAIRGPVVIHAGAGTGKTRVLSHRAAHAVATGAVRPDEILIVTFTEKAAREMAARLRVLGLAGVTARTFHAQALAQLRHFWPSRHDGASMPEVLASKAGILTRLARALPGGYRFTAARDLADEIEWAKSRRIRPPDYVARIGDRTPPLPADLMASVYRDYERAKTRAGQVDFDDLLLLAVELLETDADAAATVRARKRWFSVDEYQDTNPLQERLLELWCGESEDLCVVGDEDQTIYTFTGATSEHLLRFAERHPGARTIHLVENYRSTPEILALANRLIAATGRHKDLRATRGPGPPPVVRAFPDDEAEMVGIVAAVRGLLAGGLAPGEIAILVRTNAQIPAFETALAAAGIPFVARGGRFFDRPEIRAALDGLARRPPAEHGPALVEALRERWIGELGYDPSGSAVGAEARERQAAIDAVLGVAADLARRDPALDAATFRAELEERRRRERAGRAAAGADRAKAANRASAGDDPAGAPGGVELLTLHRAKGLEWDAVFLPALEDGLLPIRHATDDPDALAEERRLLYVGLTRARYQLHLSHAELRTNAQGVPTRRRPSPFLRDLRSPRAAGERLPGTDGGRRVVDLPPAGATAARRRLDDLDLEPDERARFERLRVWRAAQARSDEVPAYVVAHDQTLLGIARAAPRTVAALRRCPGIGPTKLERYGDAILAQIDPPTTEAG